MPATGTGPTRLEMSLKRPLSGAERDQFLEFTPGRRAFQGQFESGRAGSGHGHVESSPLYHPSLDRTGPLEVEAGPEIVGAGGRMRSRTPAAPGSRTG